MKTLFANSPSVRSRIAGSLIAAAAALTVSAVFAHSLSTQAVPRGVCKKWADDLKKEGAKKEKLRHAFVTAIRDSAKTTPEGKALRDRLLASSESAKNAVLDTFAADSKPPFFGPNFPAESWFKFYEPEVALDVKNFLKENKEPSKRCGSAEAEEHCLHIFWLPEPGTDLSGLSDDKLFFETFLACCYDPW